MAEATAVAIENVSIRYGNVLAVDDLSLRIQRGEIFGLLGPNGSGKSSTLNAVAGLLDLGAGSIKVDGISRRENPAAYAARIGFVPQELALYEELTAVDNLSFFGSLYGRRGRELKRRIAQLLDRVGLRKRAADCVRTFSGGMRRRLNLAIALVHDPLVLLLDEPSVALDPQSRDVLFQALGEFRDQGRAIILTTHHLDEVEQWCDSAGILRNGRLVNVGRPADILHEDTRGSILLGILSEELAEETEVTLRKGLGPEVEIRIIGRQIHLTAVDMNRLGGALVTLSSHGIRLESFRSQPASLVRKCPETAEELSPAGLQASSGEGAWIVI